MKRLFALTLLAAVLCAASAACAATYNAGMYYTLDYDDSLTLDITTYTEDTHPGYTWLFMLYDAQVVMDAVWEKAPAYAGVNLYEMNEPEREAYLADTLALFADSHAAYVEDITSISGYPFYIYSMDDGEGAYYYAETLIDGYSANLCAYYRDASVMPDAALLEALEEVLITIRPVDDAVVETKEA